MRKKGVVFLWNKEKAFGFIEPKGGGKVIFAHISSFQNRKRTPVVGEEILYKLTTDKKGRPCASDIGYKGDSKVSRKPRKNIAIGLLVIPVYLSWLLTDLSDHEFLMPLLFWHALVSAITYIAFAKDKRAAQKQEWRTPELVLHALSLFGGWPGAIVAQQSLRHKSAKKSFRMVLWVTIVLSISAVVALSTDEGKRLIEHISSLKPNKAEIKWTTPP